MGLLSNPLTSAQTAQNNWEKHIQFLSIEIMLSTDTQPLNKAKHLGPNSAFSCLILDNFDSKVGNAISRHVATHTVSPAENLIFIHTESLPMFINWFNARALTFHHLGRGVYAVFPP